jgi:hypothetical protein
VREENSRGGRGKRGVEDGGLLNASRRKSRLEGVREVRIEGVMKGELVSSGGGNKIESR